MKNAFEYEQEINELRDLLVAATDDIDEVAELNIHLQQRLTTAEQRNSELEALLRETIGPLEKHFSTKAWDVAAKIKRKIKPTESGASE